MEFTHNAYKKLLEEIINHRYNIRSYHNWRECDKTVILRHDIDSNLRKAVELAKIEESMGVSSTYFVLITSEFYNVFTRKSNSELKEIISMGHDIGLHFDEVRYPEIKKPEDSIEKILIESRILEKAIEQDVKVVSMHRPSKNMLEANIEIPGMVNSYGQVYFREFKYLSDSRRKWRESVEEIVAKEQYSRLHILTHAFWYSQELSSLHDTVADFVNHANKERYYSLKENITDLQDIMNECDIR